MPSQPDCLDVTLVGRALDNTRHSDKAKGSNSRVKPSLHKHMTSLEGYLQRFKLMISFRENHTTTLSGFLEEEQMMKKKENVQGLLCATEGKIGCIMLVAQTTRPFQMNQLGFRPTRLKVGEWRERSKWS